MLKVLLVMGLALGVPAWAGATRVSIFNRSGVPLRLIPKAGDGGQVCQRLRVTGHDLPSLTTMTFILDLDRDAQAHLDLGPESLVYLECLGCKGRSLTGAFTFEVLADAGDPLRSRAVGELAVVLQKGTAALRTALEAPFWVKGPGQGVVRRWVSSPNALAEALAIPDEEDRPKAHCAIM